MILSEKYIQLLEEKLNLSDYLNDDEKRNVYQKIADYLNNRTTFNTFAKYLTELINLYETLGLGLDAVIKAIMKYPSILHASKEELYVKYLIMAKIINPENLSTVRDDIFTNHPKDLMTSVATLYARISFFMSEEAKNFVRHDTITRRRVIKLTNDEFLTTYGITKGELLQKYPFNSGELAKVMEWDENVNLRNKEEGFKHA